MSLSVAHGAPNAGSLSGGPAERPGPGLVELVEGRVLVVEVDDDGLAPEAGHRGRLALHDFRAFGGDDLDVHVGLVRFVVGDRPARGTGVVEAGEAALPDLVLDADLAAQVREVTDENRVDDTVGPPDRRGQETGDGRRGHHQHQERDDDPLPERVLGARGDVRRFGVEAAAAGR